MPPKQRTQLVFGSGLDRETGVMATAPASFEDLRNVILYQGKVQTRKGLEAMLEFPATHLIAIQPLRSEGAGMIVTYDQPTGSVDVYRVDAAATAYDYIGQWFVLDGGSAPPVVITTEVFGRIFFAHNDIIVDTRAATYMYNPFGPTLFGQLEADLDDTGVEPMKFAGVVRHLDYLFGWGFGTASKNRPEMVRVSMPGQPWKFNKEHYFVIGDRRDPVLTCVPFASTLGVWKDSETHEIFGYDRATFGSRVIDPLYGCVGSRLAVNVAGAVYFWSEIGPRYNFGGGPSQDAAQPLDTFGWEPESLVVEGAETYAFADFIRDVRAVIFTYNRRVYALFLRGGMRNAKWCYWELGQDVYCSGTLFQGGLGPLTAPTGWPECTGVIRSSDGTYMDVSWDNVGATGDEIVEIWYRSIQPAAPLPFLSVDTDLDGIADGWNKQEDADHTVQFAVNTTPLASGQVIDVTDAGTGDVNPSGIWYVFGLTGTPPSEGDIIELRTTYIGSGTGHLKVGIEWRNSLGATLRIDAVDDIVPAPLPSSTVIQGTAPAATAAAFIFLYAVTDDAAEVINATFHSAIVQMVLGAGEWQVQTVEANGRASQTQRVSGLDPEQDYEVALRYRRGPFATPGYEGENPLTWPAVSRCLGEGSLTPPTISSAVWSRFEHPNADGSGDFWGGEQVEFTVAAISSVNVELWRKLASDPDFVMIETETPDGPNADVTITDIWTNDDPGENGEQIVEYKVKSVDPGSTRESPFSDVSEVWIGPVPPPQNMQVSPAAAGEYSVFVETPFTAGSWDTVQQLRQITVYHRNITDGGGWIPQDGEWLDPGTTSWSTTISGTPITGKSFEVRCRHQLNQFGWGDVSEYTPAQEVLIP